MAYNNTASRWLARVAGLAATAGALTILCSDAIRTGHWQLEHALMPIVVGITIASGHLIGSAMREWRLLSAAGFAVLFVLGTAATVYNSVGRQAATADSATLTAEDHNAHRSTVEADLALARTRLAEAEAMVAFETKKGGCGRNCKDWKQRASEVGSHIAVLSAELERIGPRQVEAPKAERAARVAALFGFERDRVREIFYLVEPFLYALLFELAAIVAFGFGFAHRPTMRVANDNEEAIPEPAEHPASLDRVVQALRAAGGELPSNDALADMLGVPKGTASKWAQALERSGTVARHRDGRTVSIRLAS